MNLASKIIIGMMLFVPAVAYSWSEEDNVHFAAHAGTAFAIDTVAYGLNSKTFGMKKDTAEELAFFETLVLGMLYKTSERSPGSLSRPMIENTVGASAAVLVHVTFDF